MASRLGDNLSSDQKVTVGYAPAGLSNLTDQLRAANGAVDAELINAGLAKWSRRGTLIDITRDPVVFGIHNSEGELVGFTGRSAPGADPGAPKWLNTPHHRSVHQRRTVVRAHEEQDLLAAGAIPVRVEGVMDALAVTRAGLGQAVGLAPLGTALTAIQVDQIAAAARQGHVLHGTDNHAAGMKAAHRDYLLLADRGCPTP